MSKLKEHLLKEQTPKPGEWDAVFWKLRELLSKVEESSEGVKRLRQTTTKAVGGRELKQFEDSLKASYRLGKTALDRIMAYREKKGQ